MDLAFVGILIRAWATGHIRKNDELTISGPYALTRNPLYFGSFVIGLGFSIAGGNLIIPGVFLACFAAIYAPVMQREMDYLAKKFPQEYAQLSGHCSLVLSAAHSGKNGTRTF